jgi:4-amino-4-deoxy-L-arabinose transferase-like glycosyltransferase
MRLEQFSHVKIKWALAGLAGILFIPFLGYVHLFDWDEINFAEISREMMVLGNYTSAHINFLPFWEKPPLFFWLQSASMNVFGVNEFAARLPNAICGMITLPILYQIGAKLYDRKFGLIWALAYFGSILPGFYFQSGIIDPFFNLFIFLGLYFFIQYYWKYRDFESIVLKRSTLHYLIIAGLFSGLAILTKGPAGFLILLLCYGTYFILKMFRIYVSIPQFILYCLVTLLVTLTWFGLETMINGPWFVEEFIKYNFRLAKIEDAGHGGFPGYHFVIIFIGCFPASLFSLRAFKKLNYEHTFQKDFKIWMMILLWVILILFSIVQSKIVHYSSMAYFPVTYLAAVVIYQLLNAKLQFQNWIGVVIKASALLIGAIMVILPYIGHNLQLILPLIDDPFTLGNLQADAGWTGFEALVGLLLIAVAFISIIFIKKQRIALGIIILFLGTAITIKLANILFAKKIEAYSQRAAVEFFESVQNEDAYVHPVGYKTYVHFYYGKIMPSQKPKVKDWTNQDERQEWQQYLMFGDIDRPVYFVTKIDKTYRFDEVPNLDSLYAKNGFVFYKRNVSK